MSAQKTADSFVQCVTCGYTRRVDFGKCLREGWPKCHDQTMRLTKTTADIEAAVGGLFTDAVQHLGKPE
jgi:hypothetical protein